MASQPKLERSLRLFDASMLVIGCIVGVGIFRTVSSIAKHVPSPSLILLLWAFGGILSLCGALCYAELASMFPASGGDYVFITKIYGRFAGFLFGWTKLFIERTGTIAILGFVFAEYCRRVIPYGETTLRIVSVLAILALTAVNVAGVRWGKYVQNLFTLLKIAALATVIAAGLYAFGLGDTVQPNWAVPSLTFTTIQSMGVALVFVLWTYGGWTEAAYVSEEVVDPTRNVPKAIVGGVLLTTVLYLLVNWSYLLFIPIDRMPETPLVASSVMQEVLGNAGAVFIAGMIACSAFGALNGYILTGARILYSMGKDHALFAKLGTIDPSYHTPALALWANAAIAILLVLTKTFDQIMTYSTIVISIFFTMAVFGVIIVRVKHPKARRPYRAWGYPVTPILFCLTMIGFMADTAIKEPAQVTFGLALLALGVPLYFFSQRLRSSR